MKTRHTRRLALALALLLLLSLPGQAAPVVEWRTMPEVVDAPLLFEAPIPATDPVDMDWFSDAVFIGDSRTEGLLLYSSLKAGLGLTHAGLSVLTARTQADFTVDHRKVTLAQALSGGSWGKVYLMLGVNEASWMDEGAFYRTYSALIDDLRRLLPDAQIYIQTLIPVTAYRSAAQAPNNARLARRSDLLAQLCRERQVYLLDVAAALSGPDGALPDHLSTDGLHLSRAGHHIWIEYLQTHTVGT